MVFCGDHTVLFFVDILMVDGGLRLSFVSCHEYILLQSFEISFLLLVVRTGRPSGDLRKFGENVVS
jgi:hypothetical protein